MSESVNNFFNKEEKEDIILAIKSAELETSGEIRVHVEEKCRGEVKDRAAYLFKQMDMHKTEKRNGVLFYLAVKNRKFAILGDIGINKAVPDDFWDQIRDRMLNHFRDNEFAEGLIEAINLAGLQLKKHFPYMNGDVNELPDEISFGKTEG
jgi:uncharacterized membrane protein